MDAELYHVTRLDEVAETRIPTADLNRVFRAPWRQVGLVTVETDGHEARDLPDSEALLYTLGGRGTATLADGDRVALHPGVSVTLLRGERLDLQAEPDHALRLFLAEIGVGGEQR